MEEKKRTVAEWLAECVEEVDVYDDFGTVMNEAIDMVSAVIAELPDGDELRSPRAAAMQEWSRIEHGGDPDGYDTDDIEMLCQAVGEVELHVGYSAQKDCCTLFERAGKLMSEAIDKIMRVKVRGEWEERDGILEDAVRGLRNLG